MNDFLMSVRAVRNGKFVAEVGPTKYLIVPNNEDPSPTNVVSAAIWNKTVLSQAVWSNESGEQRGDILFIIHGYNMSEAEVIQRHRRIRDDLVNLGFKGIVVSYDWPSDDKALAYLPDRHKAKKTAMNLVTDGISYLSANQAPDCTTNIHVLGHSTGAYVIREAFDDADDSGLPNASWGVSQVILVAGDVSSTSMSVGDNGAEAIYNHCIRLTNYASRHDQALDISNAKRIGLAPRVGRIGLPSDAPSKAVNVDCTAYFEELTKTDSQIFQVDQPYGIVGMPTHSWYFGNLAFTKDLFAVLIGIDRTVIQTRTIDSNGKISLKHI